MAKQGQMDAVKIMAKDLVRTRRYVKKFMLMRANIQALKSQSAMAQAMKGVTKAMGNMNKQMKLPEIQKNYDGIRKTVRNYGHERRNDGRR